MAALLRACKSKKKKVPTWSHTYVCLGQPDDDTVPDSHDRATLKLVGLGEKRFPTLTSIIDVFKREQAATKVALLQLQTGARPPQRNKKYVAVNTCLERLKSRMASQETSIADYIGAVAHLSRL